MVDHLLDLFRRRFSAERALACAIDIWNNQRWFSADKDRAAIETYLDAMRSAGLQSVEAVNLPADGRTSFGGVVIPKRWTVRGATLEMIAPERAVIADYRANPCHLMLYSAPTPPEGLTLTIREEDRLGDGGAIFGSIGGGHRDGVTMISDQFIREAAAAKDAIQWHNFSINPFYSMDTRGFAISRAWGDRIRGWLSQAIPVQLRATVDTDFSEGELALPTGVVQGETADEILITGHLYEQGIDDNASGPAVGLEAMRIVSALIDEGVLPRPKRTIRLLPSFEARGLQAYSCLYPERRIVAALNLDSVAADPAVPVHLIQDPYANPSAAEYLLFDLVRRACAGAEYRWDRLPYWTMDNQIADPLIGSPCPGVCICGSDAFWYHNSLDRPDIVCKGTMELIGAVAAAYAYFLACAGEEETVWLAGVAADWMATEGSSEWRVQHVIDSLVKLTDERSRDRARERIVEAMRKVPVATTKTPDVDPALRREASAICPRRLYKGFIGFDDLSTEQFADYESTFGQPPSWISQPWHNEFLFMLDGRTSVWDAYRILQQEFDFLADHSGPDVIHEVIGEEGVALDLESALRLTRFLERIGKLAFSDSGANEQ